MPSDQSLTQVEAKRGLEGTHAVSPDVPTEELVNQLLTCDGVGKERKRLALSEIIVRVTKSA